MNERLKGLHLITGSSIVLIALAACGGGGDGAEKCYSPTNAVCSALGVGRSFPEPVLSAVGMYRGVTSSGRAVAGLVLDDNSFYAVYSAINNPSLTGGSIQGTIMASGGNFSVTDAIDESVEGFGTRAVAITGTYSQRQFIKGSIGYPPTTQPISFVANYDADYESAPNLSIVAGTYTGTSKASIGSENVTLRISASGEVEGIGTSGCSFEGTIKPRSAGNAYVVNMTFGRAPCAYPGAALTGISYFDRTTNLSYTVASVQGQSTKFILIALKQ